MMGANKAARYVAQHPEVTYLVHFVHNSAEPEPIFDPKLQQGLLYMYNFHQNMAGFLKNTVLLSPPPQFLQDWHEFCRIPEKLEYTVVFHSIWHPA